MPKATLHRLSFYCITAAFGCCAAMAQQTSDSNRLRDAAEAPKFDANSVNGSPSAPTGLATWTGNFTYKGLAYSYTMVGSDPTKTCSTTTIPVYIVPLKLIYSDGTVFDPTATMINDTISAVTAVEKSPVFTPTDFSAAPVDLGFTQLVDAFQRANFWKDLSPDCGYHVLLSPTVLATQTFNVPKSGGKTEPGPLAPYLRATLAQNYIDKNITGPVFAANPQIGPGAFTIFLTYNVFPGNAYGYHAVYGNSVTTGLTYAYVSYLQPYTQLIDADISTLTHEVAEWMDDPYTNNHTPCGILEVGDPLNSAIWQVESNNRTWNPQDLAMVGYFYQTPTPSVNGWLTFRNTYTTACVNGS
jgi:hypothetical protein